MTAPDRPCTRYFKPGKMHLFKLMVSLVVFATDAFCDGLLRVIGKRTSSKCVVLYYHSIPARHRERFARQMDMLCRFTQPVSADTKACLSEGRRYAVVTFDDANENIIANALPELKSREIPATIFVITEKLGRIPDWENFSVDFTEDDRIMTLEQLQKLPSGLVTLGSHTMNHVLLTSVDIQAARDEITGSRVHLEKMVNLPVRMLSFPYGAYNGELVESCRAAGYERVFTTDPVFALTDPDEFVVGRMVVEPTDWPLEFRLKIAGAYRWMKTASTLKQSVRRMFAGGKA